MADIDSLEIEISAESSDAAQKVNSLAQALRELKSVIENSAFGSIGEQIRSVGEGATGARAKVAQKQQVLRDVGEKAKKESPARMVLDASVKEGLPSVVKEMDALRDTAQTVSGTVLHGPTIDAGVKQEIESVTKELKQMQEAAGEAVPMKAVPGSSLPSSPSQPDYLKDISQALSGTKLGGNLGNISSIVQEFDKMGSVASAAGAAVQGAGTAGAGAMAALAAAVGPVVAILEVLKQKFNENKEFLQSDRSLWTDISWDSAGEGLTNFAAALMTVNPALKAAVYGMRSFIQPGQELLGLLGNLANSGIEKLGNSLKNFASSGLQKAGDAAKRFAKNIGDGFKSIGADIGQRLIKPFTSAITTMQKWQASLGRLVFYRAINAAIRAVSEGIREGIDNLYQFSQMADGRFASSMDSLASSSLYLKNSLGAMAAPLINAAAPAIDFIISKLVTLINLIGTVFAVITGAGSFTQAKKQATAYGDALGGAAGAAKELQDYVLGIDELNIIKEPSGGGGGGGGGGMGFEDMFEEVPLPDWAKEMQDAIKKGDWYGAGAILAEHLNKIVEDWDARAWGKALGKKINNGLEFALGFLRNFNFDQFGRQLANAINGIGDGINFDTLGRVIGAGWNALFDTIDGFFTALEWDSWGKRIGQAINGIVDEINWAKIGKTILNGFIGLFTLLDNAIKEIDWPQMGSSLATMLNNVNWYGIVFTGLLTILDGIKGAAAAIEAFAKDFKWDAVATQISGGINHALSTMSESEWRSVGASIGLLFTKAFGFARDLLNGIDWPQLGRDIVALLEGVSWDSLLSAAGGALAAGFNGLIDAAYEIVSKDSFWAKLGAGVYSGVKDFFNNWKVDKALDGLSLAITRGINLAIAAINGLVQADAFWANLGNGIKTGISNFFNKINPPEVIAAITGLLQRVIDAGITAISELASHGDWWAELGTAIGNGINDLVNNTDWVGLLTGLAKLATDILTGLANALRTINWDEAWQAIKSAIDAVEWGPLVDAAMGFFAEAFKAKMELKLFEGKMFLDIGGKVGKEVVNGILEGLESIPILGWFVLFGESVITIMGDVGSLVKSILSGHWGEIPGILDTATGHMHDIVDKWGKKISGTTDSHMADTEKAITGHLETGRDNTIRLTKEMFEAATQRFLELHNDAESNMKRISEIVNTEWTATQTDTTEIVGNVANIASDLFETMRLTVETKTGNIKTTSGTNWMNTKTETASALEEMLRSTDTNYSGINKSVTTNLAGAEAENAAKWTAMQGVTKAQQAAMHTSTILQYAAMNKTVSDSLQEADRATSTGWGEIVSTTTTKAGEVLSSVKEKINQVSGAVTSGLNAAKTAASTISFYSIGTNIIEGVSAGVREKASELARTVSNSILNAAEAARRAAQIHSPSRLFRDKIGILLGLGIAEGVEDSARDIVSSIQNINAQMLGAFDLSNLPQPQEMQFPVHEDYSARYQVEYTYDTQREEDAAQRFTEGVRMANEDVITALYAVASRLVEAVNSADNQPRVYLDGKEITNNVEKHQRQRGANILAGGLI